MHDSPTFAFVSYYSSCTLAVSCRTQEGGQEDDRPSWTAARLELAEDARGRKNGSGNIWAIRRHPYEWMRNDETCIV